ncbi:MAG: DUF423 domain-containing protein [Ectothiorhodospiraceae bacterium]|nr:DUF423 domain-containing protein [Ectothiorhodospiraceae bacterium]
MPDHRRPWIRVAAVLGALAVGLGAFGAHGLRAVLDPAALEVWRTAVLYHALHTLALLALALAGDQWWQGAWARRAAVCFTAGVLVFSGSLYLLTLSGARWLGAVTPLGGLAFIAGWLCLVGVAGRRR